VAIVLLDLALASVHCGGYQGIVAVVIQHRLVRLLSNPLFNVPAVRLRYDAILVQQCSPIHVVVARQPPLVLVQLAIRTHYKAVSSDVVFHMYKVAISKAGVQLVKDILQRLGKASRLLAVNVIQDISTRIVSKPVSIHPVVVVAYVYDVTVHPNLVVYAIQMQAVQHVNSLFPAARLATLYVPSAVFAGCSAPNGASANRFHTKIVLESGKCWFFSFASIDIVRMPYSESCQSLSMTDKNGTAEELKSIQDQQCKLRKRQREIGQELDQLEKKRKMHPLVVAEQRQKEHKQREEDIRNILWCKCSEKKQDATQRKAVLEDCLQNVSVLEEFEDEEENDGDYGDKRISKRYTLQYTYKQDRWEASGHMDDGGVTCLTDKTKDKTWEKTREPGAMLAHFWHQRFDCHDGPLGHFCACSVALDCSDTF
jgi:hypothetical protein